MKWNIAVAAFTALVSALGPAYRTSTAVGAGQLNG